MVRAEEPASSYNYLNYIRQPSQRTKGLISQEPLMHPPAATECIKKSGIR
jgi:hypothetical protein